MNITKTCSVCGWIISLVFTIGSEIFPTACENCGHVEDAPDHTHQETSAYRIATYNASGHISSVSASPSPSAAPDDSEIV